MRSLSLLPLLALGCGGPTTTTVTPPPVASVSATASAPAASASAAPKNAWSAPVALTAEAKQTIGAGTTFVAPAGWTISVRSDAALVTGPEPDLKLGVFDMGATSADEAVKLAWEVAHPGFARPLKLAQTRPGRRGWDEQRVYTYETSPNEKAFVLARALRKGNRWVALALESGHASIEKRGAQLRKIGDTLQPPGFTRESFAAQKAHPLDDARVKAILASADKARLSAGIPGEGIALVQDGKIVFEGGLGVRVLGKPEKVVAHTAFMIASNTKALTTLLLAKLVDEKKFAFDTPVTSLYPAFKLGDADTTKKVLVSHLICACTGMPRQDLEWLFQFQKQTPKAGVELLGTMQPTTKFGETFQYSNLMAAAAGYVGGYVLSPKKELGAAYDEAMQTRVFDPLGMKETTFDWARAMKANHATGHALDVDGRPATALMELNRAVAPHRPAGGAWSTPHDMAQYVLMELANGMHDGKRYIGEDALLARRKPQVAIGEFVKYGMGLFVDIEFGLDVVHQGGDLFGNHSDMFWIPAVNVGGVLLGNGDAYLVRKAFIRKVLEVIYDGSPEADEDVENAINEYKQDLAHERKRLTIPADPTFVAKLAAKYSSTALGELVVKTDKLGTTFDFGGWKSVVATRTNDDKTVSFITYAAGGAGVAFVVGERDGKRTLTVRDAQHEYVYVETAKGK